jgi:hypothetical protein
VLRCLIAAIAGAVVAVVVRSALDGFIEHDAALDAMAEKVQIVLVAGAATILGGAVYLGVAALLRVRELNTLLAIVVDLVRRRGRA